MESKINNMGSEVVDGFVCKPKVRDNNKPIMYYKSHVFVCSGERCKKALREEEFPKRLRGIIKDLSLSRGKSRIKVSQVDCFGACRFGAVTNIYINSANSANGIINNALWIKKVHKFSEEKWKNIFNLLSNEEPLGDFIEDDEFIEMDVFE